MLLPKISLFLKAAPALLLSIFAVATPGWAQCTQGTGSNTTSADCPSVRWEADTSGSTASHTQTDSKTAPDFLFKLDWQLRSPWSGNAGNPVFRNFVSHLIFRTGLLQATVADKVQPATTSTNDGTLAANPCPGSSPAGGAATTDSSSMCTTLTNRQAFVAEIGGNLGFSVGAATYGTVAEFGLAYKGSFQKLVTADQLVQKDGLTYLDLSKQNLRDAVGVYEVVGRFKLGGWGHNDPGVVRMDGSKEVHPTNPEDLLIFEAGYQNNSALQHLIRGQPGINTRNRFVGRFYAFPEIDKAKHTKILVGMEYNAGFNGGPREIKLFYGAQLELDKLFK